MAIGDKVESEMRRHPALTARELSAAIFGLQDGYQQRVNPVCVRLCKDGKAYRTGNGTAKDPYRYTYGEPRA